MNTRKALIGLTFAALWLTTGGIASAQNNPLITVDEFGNGSLVFPGGGNFLSPGFLAPDPGPGGLPAVLTYNLLGPPALVAGDLILLEPGAGIGTISDIIRFNPQGTGGQPFSSLVFYSDNFDGVDAVADIGFPGALYANNLSVFEQGPEGNNGFTYTPTANDPGFIPGFSVTYRILSDVPTPEPGSLGLFAMGALGVGLVCARSSRKRLLATAVERR